MIGSSRERSVGRGWSWRVGARLGEGWVMVGWGRGKGRTSKTLLHKDCRLGSVRNLTTSPC